MRDGKVLLMRSHVEAWRTAGSGTHRAKSWVAVNTEFDRFYYWTHEAFLSRLDSTQATTPTIYRRLPDELLEFRHANELALEIIRCG